MPYYIIGNGSNLLVGDGGIRGVVIETKGAVNALRTEGERIVAGAGALLSQAASRAASMGLSGMEFAAGIPGTVGGAVVMNAGAYGGEMKDILESVGSGFPSCGGRGDRDSGAHAGACCETDVKAAA